MTTEVIGYTKKELIELMLGADIHCSVDRFVALAVALQTRALTVDTPTANAIGGQDDND